MTPTPHRFVLSVAIAALGLAALPASSGGSGEGTCESRYVGGLGVAPEGNQPGYGAFIGCAGNEATTARIEISWLPGTSGTALIDVVESHEVELFQPHDSIIRVSCEVEIGLARCATSGSRSALVTYDPLGPVVVSYQLPSPAWLWTGHWTAVNLRDTGVLVGGGSFRLHYEYDQEEAATS